MLVCAGTAAAGDHSQCELRRKDMRPCDPGELRILHRLHSGLSLGRCDAVAAPCTIIEYLWAYPMQGMMPYVGESVGLFGAIEFGHAKGPLLMNWPYHLVSEVVCVGQSRQTEYVWYETTASNEAGDVVATMLMQSRATKASSPAYQE